MSLFYALPDFLLNIFGALPLACPPETFGPPAMLLLRIPPDFFLRSRASLNFSLGSSEPGFGSLDAFSSDMCSPIRSCAQEILDFGFSISTMSTQGSNGRQLSCLCPSCNRLRVNAKEFGDFCRRQENFLLGRSLHAHQGKRPIRPF